jgi:hypothetical protein
MVIKNLIYCFQIIDSACFDKTDIQMIAVCAAQARLTSPKKIISSSWSKGKPTAMTISPSTLVTDSTTPPAGIKKLTPREVFDQLLGQDKTLSIEDIAVLGKSGLDGEDWRLGDRLASDEDDVQLGEDQPKWPGNGTSELLGLAKNVKMSESESHAAKLAESASTDTFPAYSFSAETFSAFSSSVDRFSSPKAKSDVSGSFSSLSPKEQSGAFSSIASEISVRAKLSGPIGITMGLAPVVLTEVNVKGTEKDKLSSTEPDRIKLTEPAIPSLKKKNETINKMDAQNLTGFKKCSTSKIQICLHFYFNILTAKTLSIEQF